MGKETLFQPPSGYIQSWGDYLLDTGIERRHPSHSMKPVCEMGVYTPVCIFWPGKSVIFYRKFPLLLAPRNVIHKKYLD